MKGKTPTWKSTVKFLLGFGTTILLIVSTATSSWGVLTNETTGEEIARFGIWRSCKKSLKDSEQVCENFHGGNFTVYSFKDNVGIVDIDCGSKVNEICIEYRNVTVTRNVTISNSTTAMNLTEVQKSNLCNIEVLFDRARLERCRVFCILSSVISFLVTVVFAGAFVNEEMNGFTPAVASLLIPIWFIISIAVFSSLYDERFDLVKFQFAWSYILAWIGALLSIFNTLFAMFVGFTG